MSTVSAFKSAFQTALEAISPALDGITVYTSEQSAPDTAREHIILGDWEEDREHHAMGGVFLQTVDITCRITIHRPTQDAATLRAEAILTEIKTYLSTATNWTVGSTLDVDLVSSSGEESISADEGRKCEIEFVIRFRDTNE